MNIFKKTNNKETKKLPMTGKVKKGFRAYCAVVLCMALIGCMSMTAFAASGDPLTVINNLSDFTYPARLRYCSGRSFPEIPRSFAESQRLPYPCRRCHHHLCKGNPHSHYRLSKETLKRGISEKSGMPQICKGGASI